MRRILSNRPKAILSRAFLLISVQSDPRWSRIADAWGHGSISSLGIFEVAFRRLHVGVAKSLDRS